jgi:hypothetical protein
MTPHPNNPAIMMLDSRSPLPQVAKYSGVGCYPVFYVTADGGVLSAAAVEENLEACCDPDDPGWFVVGHDANWENPDLYCDHTGERIESAYAD